ncbi:UNVERIFIED_ORG: hypothetical protein OKW14_004660 [Pantoea brenneri]|nr:hypothetical protein [Pantoea brenneri]
MAWHSVRQALELTGKARSTLYRDMAKGRVSYRSEADGGRSLETSELIRVYGELRQVEHDESDTKRQPNETANIAIAELVSEIRALREEVTELKTELQGLRRLEHKSQSSRPEAWWRFWRRNRNGL